MQHWDKPRKPSPVIFLSGLGDVIRESVGYLFLLALSFFFRKENPGSASSKGAFWAYAIGGFLALVLLLKSAKIFAWFFTRYWVEKDKIILTSGIFVKSRVELALSKIQTIQVHQNLLHRLTDTCRFVLDTAGSEKPEFVIDAMRLDDARALQQWIRNQENTVLQSANEEETQSILSLTGMDYLKLCISENHFKSLMIIVAFVIGKAQDISERIGLDSFGFLKENTERMMVSVTALTTLIIFALLISIVFSTVRVLLRFYNYRVLRRKETYEWSWGLFTRQRKSMPFAKMEFISWSANWLRGKWDLFVLRIHSLAESETNVALHMQMPVTSRQMLKSIAHQYLPELPSETGEEATGIQKAYFYRFMAIGSLVFIPATLGLAWWFTWKALGVLILFGYLLVSRYVAYRNFKIWLRTDALQMEKGVWGRNNMVVSLDKVISVNLKTSPFQRANGYANLQVNLPGDQYEIPYLTKETAADWADLILQRIEE